MSRKRVKFIDQVRAALDARAGIAEGDFARYRGKPAKFAADILGIKLWSHQVRALEAIVAHRRVAWKTAHGVGKSTVSVVAAIYWAAVYPGALALLTAPSYRQVSLVLWRTLQRLHRDAKQPLGAAPFDVPERGWRLPTGSAVIGFTADSPENLSGLHAEKVLFIVDEASGVDGSLFDAVKGSLTGDSRLFLIGNPTRQSGEFHAAFHSKSSLYCQLHTSAFDSPNVSGLEPPIPGLADKEWLDELAADFGTESAAFTVRGRGDFASQPSDAVYAQELIEQARERWHALRAQVGTSMGRLEVGVDVARFGDDETVVICRRGLFMYEPVAIRRADAVTVADFVMQEVAAQVQRYEKALIRVDATGVGGPVADILRRQHGHIIDVVDVVAGATPRSPRYMRTRDELLWSLRDWLRSGGALPPDARLEGELLAPTYSYSPTARLQVEPKDETKKKLKRSPDRMDAAALAVYAVAAQTVEAVQFRWGAFMRGEYSRRHSVEPSLPTPYEQPPPANVREIARRWRVIRGGQWCDVQGGWDVILTGTIVDLDTPEWSLDRFRRLQGYVGLEPAPL